MEDREGRIQGALAITAAPYPPFFAGEGILRAPAGLLALGSGQRARRANARLPSA